MRARCSALGGVSAVYLVSPAIQGDPVPILVAFTKEAIEAGVRRFVLLSASLLPAGGPAMGQVHQWLEQNASEWAVLRPSWFMQNFSEGPHRESIRATGRIYSAAGDGPVPFIDADDIARCAAAVLVAEEAPNKDFVLTGSDLLTYDDVARRIGRAVGRDLTHVRLNAEQLASAHASRGLSPAAAQMLATMDTAISLGAENRVTDGVKQLTGTAPVGFDAFVAENAGLWAG